MRFAICNETFQDWTFEAQCRRAAELGYTGLEIAPFTLAPSALQIDTEMRRECVAIAKAHDLEIIGLHWLLAGTQGYYITSPDSAITEATVAYFQALIALCHDLGGSLMVLGSPKQRNLLPNVTHAQAVGFAAALLRRIVPQLEATGITLAVEPLGPEEGDFLNTAAAAVDLIQQVDSSHVRLHLDVKAMSTETETYANLIRQNRTWLHHFHANDPNRRGPGMGEVDFHPILAALQEIRYEGWVSVEVFDYTPGPEVLAKDSIDYLRRTSDDLPNLGPR